MNKHILGYGLASMLFIATATASAVGLQKNNETIEELKISNTLLHEQIKILNIEKEDVKSTNFELFKKVQSFEENIETLNKDKQNLLQELKIIKEEAKSWTTFTATYYDANYISTGKSPGDPYYGITASGEPVREGVTVAVDPRVIPLGSWVEIKYPDGRIEKRKATDTGGAIKGKKIDIYIAKASYTSGKHPVKVRIIN